MSRAEKRSRGNSKPINATVTYKPNSGEFQIYNKKTKKKSTVEEVRMIILDADRFSLSGYSPEHETGFISNYVFNSKEEEFTVGIFSKKGKYREISKGYYQQIKDKLEGIKYTKPVIGLVELDGELVMAEFLLTGSAKNIFTKWFDENEDASNEGAVIFTPSKLVYEYVKSKGDFVEVPENKQKRWMTTWIYKLEINLDSTSDDENETALNEDILLQKYFKGAGSIVKSDNNESTMQNDNEDEDHDLPF